MIHSLALALVLGAAPADDLAERLERIGAARAAVESGDAEARKTLHAELIALSERDAEPELDGASAREVVLAAAVDLAGAGDADEALAVAKLAHAAASALGSEPDAVLARACSGVAIVEAETFLRSDRPADAAVAIDDLFPHAAADPFAAPALRVMRAEAARRCADWERADAELDAAGSALAPLEDPSIDAAVRDYAASQRRELESIRARVLLDQGVADQAAAHAERSGSLLLQADVALAGARYAKVVRLLAPLAPSGSDAPQRAIRLALAKIELAAAGGADTESAEALLDAALADPSLDEANRCMAERVRVRLFLRFDREADARGAIAAALRRRSGVSRQATSIAALDEDGALQADAVRLARRGGEPLAKPLDALELTFEALLDAWRRTPARSGGIGFLAFQSRRAILGEIVAARLALAPGDVDAAVDPILRAQALGTLARRLGADPGSLAQVRKELLVAGAGLLLYLPSDDTAHVFAIDAQGAVHAEVPWRYLRDDARVTLDDRLDAAVFSDRAGAAALDAAADDVARSLLPAAIAERMRSWTGAYVAGGDLLGGVRFALLPFAGSRLGLALPLSMLPSLPVALQLRRRSIDRAKSDGPAFALLAAPVPSRAATQRWPEAVRFAIDPAALDRLLAPFDRPIVFIREDATRAALESLVERPPNVLHLVTHGVSDGASASGVALLLAAKDDDSGALDVAAARRLLGARLVILSVCRAGASPLRLGDDGGAHFGGACLEAGADCVILSRSALALAPQLELSERLHREIAGGAPPADALRRAAAEWSEAHEGRLDWALLEALGLGLAPR